MNRTILFVAALSALLVTAPPARATYTNGPCAGTQGVTVVVDFGFFGSSPVVRCVLGDPTSGWNALLEGGFVLTSVPGFPNAAVCKIDGQPTAGYPYCWFNGYWSYWHSINGGAWTYSSLGAAAFNPRPGDVEGWSFALGTTGTAPSVGPWFNTVPTGPWNPDGALDWLEEELAANGGTLPSFFSAQPDWGLTIDAVLALAADGRGAGAPVGIAMSALAQNVDSYVTWDDFDIPGVLLSGQVAKTMLAAAIHGDDVHRFGGRDLEADLRSMMQAAGDQAGRFSDVTPFDDNSNGFGQSLAVLALDRTSTGVPAQAVVYLLDQQCANGGFRLFYLETPGCESNGDADPDSTAMALQALLALDATPAITTAIGQAKAWLLSIQDEGGGFGGGGPASELNTNSTGLAAQALRAAGEETPADFAASFVVALQLTTGNATGTPAAPDIGAIAYIQSAFNEALGYGIEAAVRDQWRRATAQAVLALDLPAFGVIPAVPPPTVDATASVPPFEVKATAKLSKLLVQVANSGITPITVASSDVAVTVRVNGVVVSDPIAVANSAPKSLAPGASRAFSVTWAHGDTLDPGDVVTVTACADVAGDERPGNDCGDGTWPNGTIDAAAATTLPTVTSKKKTVTIKSAVTNVGTGSLLLRSSVVEVTVLKNGAAAGGTITSRVAATKRKQLKPGARTNYTFVWTPPGPLAVGDMLRVQTCARVPGDVNPADDCSEVTSVLVK